jgi:hypothetical protein
VLLAQSCAPFSEAQSAEISAISVKWEPQNLFPSLRYAAFLAAGFPAPAKNDDTRTRIESVFVLPGIPRISEDCTARQADSRGKWSTDVVRNRV